MKINTLQPKKPADFDVSIRLLNDIFSEFAGFKPYTTDFAFSKTKGLSPLIIEVHENNQLIAYALCFEKIKNYFHIWDIGTKENYRGRGIASKIYDFTENFAKKNNYQGITINTFNRFPNNIRLLVGRGYEIHKLENTGKYNNDPKIHLRLKFK